MPQAERTLTEVDKLFHLDEIEAYYPTNFDDVNTLVKKITNSLAWYFWRR